jgi:hypothetical protein
VVCEVEDRYWWKKMKNKERRRRREERERSEGGKGRTLKYVWRGGREGKEVWTNNHKGYVL